MRRVVIFLLASVAVPVFAADYTPWQASNELSPVELLLAQAGSSGSQSKPQNEQDYPGRYCCRHCRHNEVPCEGKCLVKKSGVAPKCNSSAGCACRGKP